MCFLWYNIRVYIYYLFERCVMAVSYNKLWKLLIDKNMKKKELSEAAGISNTLIAKLGKNENVTV